MLPDLGMVLEEPFLKLIYFKIFPYVILTAIDKITRRYMRTLS